MKYIITVVLVSCLTTLVSAQSTREAKFKQVESLKDKISDHSLIVKHDKIQSKLFCARECSDNDHCSSFFYNKNKRFCSLHSKREIGLDKATDMEGTMFFKLFTGEDHSSKGYSFSKTAGIWYKGYPERINWTSASATCEGDGGILISPITQQKLELVNHLRIKVLGNWWPWIGCKAERGQWLWRDGTPVDGTNWWPGEPNSNSDGQCCVQGGNMKFYSASCSDNQRFGCEISP